MEDAASAVPHARQTRGSVDNLFKYRPMMSRSVKQANVPEFGRLLPEDQSEDVEMQDVVHAHQESPAPNQPHPNITQPNGIHQHNEDTDMAQRSQSQNLPSIEQQEEQQNPAKFIIAIDFGTTFSSVAFVRQEPGTSARLIGSESIRCIDNYPELPPGGSATVLFSNPTVPTELLCYTQKGKSYTEDASYSDSSDGESTCSMDEQWASPEPDNSDQEQHTPSRRARSRTAAIEDSIWGWGVHSRLLKPGMLSSGFKHLKNFKLQLDESSSTVGLRNKSKEDMKAVKAVKVVDIIAGYLTQLLRHAKERLTAFHGLRDNSPVEFVLCVPTAWTDKACRIMQNALTRAIQSSRITKLDGGIIKDLFIVAEPEAAAAYALDDHASASNGIGLISSESFLVLDCGGGTVDGITYTLVRTTPTRLKEVVGSEGVSCGSSFLNERFGNLLKDRLKYANIVGNDLPLDSIIAAKVQEFETTKRQIDILDKTAKFDPVYIQGLQVDEEHDLKKKNKLEIRWKEMYNVFIDSLRGVSDLMLKQLGAAKERHVNVQTVILIGGFGESPSLQNHLRRILRRERNLVNQSIDLVPASYTESAVARGAVLRALRKEDGPERITRSSYGVLRNDRYNHEDPKHRKFRVYRDPADGEMYIRNTIHWVVDKDTLVPTRHPERVRSRHVFKVHEEKFLCEEVLYVSSSKHPSGYKVGHPANKGAEEAGRILTDLTFLKTHPLYPPVTEQNAEGKLFSYYEIVYDLWLIIEGRTLRFEARSPIDDNEVRTSKQFCIAAGFVPGTA